MKKRVIKIIIILIIVITIALTGGSFYFYNVAIARTSKDFLNTTGESKTSQAVIAENQSKYAWFDAQTVKNVSIKSDDGLKLHAYFIAASNPTKKTVIIAHGYGSRAKEMANYAEFYHDVLGFNVLMPDARGHGESEGNYIGFGWPERRDYVEWINYVLNTQGKDSEITLHGVSMGGATVLMTSGEDLPSNVKAIVADCAYTSAEDELKFQLNQMYHLPAFPIINCTSLLTKIRAGYFFGDASAIKQVAKTNIPILFIHGDADTFVPFEMVNKLYAACHSEKELYLVHGAKHAKAYSVDKNGYEKKVSEFLSKYVSK